MPRKILHRPQYNNTQFHVKKQILGCIWRKGNSKLTQTVKISVNVPQKTRNEPVIWTSSINLGHMSKELYILIVFNTWSSVFTDALLTIVRKWKQSRCVSNAEWLIKMGCIYTMECYSVVKEDENFKFTDKWVGLKTNIMNNSEHQ